MVLIIAEKPSLARNICAGIGQMTKKGNYFEGCGYLVTWAFGHLFSLADIEDYSPVPPETDEKGRVKWTIDNLPCFPDRFRFKPKSGNDKKPDEGVLKQIALIRQLCNRPDVDVIANAGDSDREGEIIVRLCVMHSLKTPKKFVRLWLPDQTPETVAVQLADMKDESEYDNLANEGFARTYIDWLYGVNLTRYATLKTGTLLRVGRVIIPIVKAIYDRDLAIRNFVPGIYYGVKSEEETKGEAVPLTSKKEFDADKKADAEAYCALLNAQKAVVTDKKKKKGTLQPGKLFSLTKLQNVLSRKYKMSMSDSLAAVQKLYEAGYCTYPRTNSEYLATAEKDKVKGILEKIRGIGYPVVFKDKKTIFDDSKIESHSALTPTHKLPQKGALGENEEKVYRTVFRRFVAVFCEEECEVDNTEIKIAVGQVEEFTLKGSVIRKAGWTKYDDSDRKDRILPPLEKGDEVNICFKPTEKQTSPPKHYTVETLNNYLKNPFREEKAAAAENAGQEGESDEEDYRAIFEGLELGTEATRTGIIDNARASEYILLTKDVYTIQPKGEFLIESLQMMGISMDKYKTSQMGRVLKQIFHGQKTISDGVIAAEEEISAVFDVGGKLLSEDIDTGLYGEEVGICPLCGEKVIRGRYFYGCTGYRDKGCQFKVGLKICSRVISKANMKLLLETGRTARIDGFVSGKTGKKFSGVLKLENGKAVFDFG